MKEGGVEGVSIWHQAERALRSRSEGEVLVIEGSFALPQIPSRKPLSPDTCLVGAQNDTKGCVAPFPRRYRAQGYDPASRRSRSASLERARASRKNWDGEPARSRRLWSLGPIGSMEPGVSAYEPWKAKYAWLMRRM